MERVVVNRYGGPEVLEVVEQDAPHPGRGEVRVRVLAAGVSYADLLIRAGAYLGGPKPPFTPGYELVGIVDELGEDCSSVREGDRVAALTVWGSYAEQVCLSETEVVPVPADIDSAKAVSLVLNYVTAQQLLHRIANAEPGESVLVHGAAGGVGTAVLQLARLADLRVYGTASSSKCDLVERLGGIAIDHTKDDFLARVRLLTGDGVDVALDGIGGSVSLRSYRTLRRGGRLVIFGHASTIADGRRSVRGWISWYAATGYVGARGLASPRRSVLPYRIARVRDRHPGWFRDDLIAVAELLSRGEIDPIIAGRLPLREARRAHELLGAAAVQGKLVLMPGSATGG